jgi:hypothetical protein
MSSRRLVTARRCLVAGSLTAAIACATAEDTEPSGRPLSGRGGVSGSGDSASGASAGDGGASGSLGVSGNGATAGTGSGGASDASVTGGTGGTASNDASMGRGGTNGSAGTSGSSGTAGSGGTSGTNGAGGTAGRGGTTGSAGTTGTAGTAGTAGRGGSAGTGGTSGTAGMGGTSGTAGTNGASGTGGGGPTCSIAGLVFCDDFEDGNAAGWTTTGGTWSVISDQSYVYAGGSGSYNSTAGSSWGDQSVEVRMKILQFGGSGSSYRAGVVARNAQGSNFYALALDAAGDLRLLRGSSSPSGASGTCDAVASGVSPVTNTWVKLKIAVSGTGSSVRIRSWLNDGTIHDCTTTSSTIPTGNAGVMTYGSSTRAEFDDFRVSTP